MVAMIICTVVIMAVGDPATQSLITLDAGRAPVSRSRHRGHLLSFFDPITTGGAHCQEPPGDLAAWRGGAVGSTEAEVSQLPAVCLTTTQVGAIGPMPMSLGGNLATYSKRKRLIISSARTGLCRRRGDLESPARRDDVVIVTRICSPTRRRPPNYNDRGGVAAETDYDRSAKPAKPQCKLGAGPQNGNALRRRSAFTGAG